MEESPAISDIPEPCRIWTGIRTSLERGVQHLARMSFGRSNVDLLQNSHIYHLPNIQLDPTIQTLRNFRLVHHFSDLFSARERIRPEFISFINGISDILFEGRFSHGGLCFILKHIPLILKVFLQYDLHHRAGVKPA